MIPKRGIRRMFIVMLIPAATIVINGNVVNLRSDIRLYAATSWGPLSMRPNGTRAAIVAEAAYDGGRPNRTISGRNKDALRPANDDVTTRSRPARLREV